MSDHTASRRQSSRCSLFWRLRAVELRFTAGLSAVAIIRDPRSRSPSIGDLEVNVTPLIRLASLMNMERRGIGRFVGVVVPSSADVVILGQDAIRH